MFVGGESAEGVDMSECAVVVSSEEHASRLKKVSSRQEDPKEV